MYRSSGYSGFFLDTFENWFKFFFFDLRLVDVDFLVNGVLFWLNISVVLNSISWYLNGLLYLFVRILSWKNNRLSFNYFVFSINEFRFGSDELVQNSGLFNNLLSDW